jgi:Zinc-finger
MDIMGALSAVKQTIDITKELRNIDEKIDAATWKLKLNDIIEKLIDTKDALVEARDIQNQLRAEIDRLNKKLEQRGKLRDENGLLFDTDDAGESLGEPYCNQCFVKEEKLYRMVQTKRAAGSGYCCNNCNTLVITNRAEPPSLQSSRRMRSPYER